MTMRDGRTARVAGPGRKAARGEAVSKPFDLDCRHVALDRDDLAGDEVRLTDEVGDEAVGRAVVKLARTALLRDGGIAHHDDLVRHGQRLLLIVGDVDDGQAEVLLDGADVLAHLSTQLGVEVRERFVEEQNLGL